MISDYKVLNLLYSIIENYFFASEYAIIPSERFYFYLRRQNGWTELRKNLHKSFFREVFIKPFNEMKGERVIDWFSSKNANTDIAYKSPEGNFHLLVSYLFEYRIRCCIGYITIQNFYYYPMKSKWSSATFAYKVEGILINFYHNLPEVRKLLVMLRKLWLHGTQFVTIREWVHINANL